MSDVCPKCKQERPAETEACARCGLVFVNWTPEKAEELALKLDDKGAELWAEVLAAWADDGKHDAFLKYCSMASLLPVAGRHYKHQLDQKPGDLVGTKMVERIFTMATVTFAQPSTPPVPVTRTKDFWVLIIVCVIAGILGAFIFAW